MTIPQKQAYTLHRAFQVLHVDYINNEEDILTAFRQRVKEASDGQGNYRGDMDELTKAKDFALLALQKVQEQMARDQARTQEAKERQREKGRRKQQAHQEQAHQQPEEQAETTHNNGNATPLQNALSLLQQRQGELAAVKQKEQELLHRLTATQAERQRLEQVVQQAHGLARQIQTLLSTTTEQTTAHDK